MNEFSRLVEIAEILLSPEGCPWDRKQTFSTLQTYLLEEVYELLEALDGRDPNKIKEELGDVFYTLVFIAKIGEKEQLFSLAEALYGEAEKLVRRHPHVFGEQKGPRTEEEILRKWEEVKKHEGRKNPLEGLPPHLPALARAQKMIQIFKRLQDPTATPPSPYSEEELGEKLWKLVEAAEASGIHAESALRRFCERQKLAANTLIK